MQSRKSQLLLDVKEYIQQEKEIYKSAQEGEGELGPLLCESDRN